MKCYFFFLLFVLLGLWNHPVFGETLDNPKERTNSIGTNAANASPVNTHDTDATSFAAGLRQLQAQLGKKPDVSEIRELRSTLPQEWTVTTAERSYSISTTPLTKLLESAEKNPAQRRDRLSEAQQWVDALATEIEGYSAKAPGSSLNAQAMLKRILARSEFAAVTRPPSPWEQFRQQLIDWLRRILMKLLGGMARHPIGGKILFWLIMIGGIVWIAVWLLRFWSRMDRMHVLRPSESILAARTWQEWIRIAREAANRGDFREAVHSAYWAGIVRLEDAGVVPKDRTKTPREYLRMVSDPASGGSASRMAHRQPLGVLTTLLEKIWYANISASPEDFLDSLRQLEALGCQLE